MSVGGYQYINGITTGVQTTNGNGVGLNITASGAGIRLNNGQISGLAKGSVGSASTDAINGSQLYSVSSSLANALGGGSAVNADGTVSAPSYTVGGTTVNSVGGAIANLDGRVTTNATNIAGNTDAITNLTTNVNNGTVGLVQQAAAGADLTVGKATDGVAVDFADRDGNTRTLKNVTAGAVNATSVDAVNGSQLYGVGDSVAKALGGGSTVGADGKVSAPSYSVGGSTVNNVGDAVTNLDGRVTLNKSAIDDNKSAIEGLTDDLSKGTVGLVQQAAAGANLTVGKATDGVAVDFADRDGNTRTLKNVTAGAVNATSMDAVNGSQLYGVGDSVAKALGGGSAVGADGKLSAPSYSVNGSTVSSVGDAITNIDDRVTQNTGAIDGIKGDLASGTIGLVQQAAAGANLTVGKATDGVAVDFADRDGNTRTLKNVTAGIADYDAVNMSQLNATNGRLSTAETKIAGNTSEITNISNKLDNGTVGLVKQDATTNAITVAGDKAGTSVNFAGTDGERVLSGVAAGKAETDAVNVGQLKKAGLVDAGGNTLDAVTYDAGSNRGTVTFNQGGAAVLLQNVGAGMANTDAANVGQLREVASSLGGGATIDANGKMVAPSYTVNNATYGSVRAMVACSSTRTHFFV
ncbi:hypothetical protein [Variovorax saccharolyticus]|uniref:hypothetical protein n=1 Tax=Variovorax saccharolyticus TaxID=3053516 RepID=UPI002575B254|nr:hypothetical protein [Variovorax sp. J22R187]